jgi:catechol 2,3-dioxygenase-like lactoylglutathione lyase family enzyme
VLDHLSLPVGDFARARAFYDALLAALGQRCVQEMEEDDFVAAGYGGGYEPAFWIGALKPNAPVTPLAGQHIAFRARDRADVEAFHRAGLAAGGIDNGPPGLRPHYHPNYYAAFIIDPDGHHLEAVCHDPA